jgi:hypothetical protein
LEFLQRWEAREWKNNNNKEGKYIDFFVRKKLRLLASKWSKMQRLLRKSYKGCRKSTKQHMTSSVIQVRG